MLLTLQTRQYGGFPGMGGYPGGGGYAGGGGFRGGRDNEPEVSLEDLLENVEVMKQNIRDMKVLRLPRTSPRFILAVGFMSGVHVYTWIVSGLARHSILILIQPTYTSAPAPGNVWFSRLCLRHQLWWVLHPRCDDGAGRSEASTG